MTGLPILENCIREAIARTGGGKPIFSARLFAEVLRDEFDLRRPPCLEVIERILTDCPWTVKMDWESDWWIARPRSMLKP